MATKAILNLTDKATAIEDAAKLNQGAVTTALTGKFPTPVVIGEDNEEVPAELVESVPTPDWAVLQAFVAQELERSRRLLLETANSYEREVQEDPAQREVRDAVVASAYQQFVTVRQVLEAAIGEAKAFEFLGVEGTTPQRAKRLLERMREASLRLRDPERRPTDLRMPGMTQDWTGLADTLDREADLLQEVVEQQREERRNAELALVERERAHEAFNNTYVGFARMLDGLYVAADHRELASRLRLTEPASNSNDETDGEVPGPEDVPSPDTPPGPPPGVPGPPNGQGGGEQVFPVAAVDLDDANVRPIVALPSGTVTTAGDRDS